MTAEPTSNVITPTATSAAPTSGATASAAPTTAPPTTTASTPPTTTASTQPTTTSASQTTHDASSSTRHRPDFPKISYRSHEEEEIEYEGYDGWYNNRAHPEWGAVDSPLTRRVPSHYEDGVYQPSGASRPNPLTLSQELMRGNFGEEPDPGSQNKTALLVFFGEYDVMC